MEMIRSYWKTNPLTIILLLAILTRLIAAIFSKGYGMHDDHFLVIETAQSWLDHAGYNNWFKERETQELPTILNFGYAGIHYLLFSLLEFLKIMDPQWKMFIVRILHGAFSLVTVVLGYRITEKIAGHSEARLTGLLLAVYWFMPFMAVRNLVEVFCIPFMLWGLWYTITSEDRKNVLWWYFLAGIFFGIAFSIRFQTIVFGGTVGLLILVKGKWKEALMMVPGFFTPVILLHGLPDWLIWGFPFAEIKAYVTHNVEHRFDYNVSPWYTYLLMLAGVLIFPVALFLFIGFFRSWRKHLILFLPILAFIIFHSAFPNKQERFIIPIIPFFIILGVTGWMDLVKNRPSLREKPLWLKGSWIFFWTVNIILLVLFTTMYSKKARVEASYYLYGKENTEAIIVEESVREHATMMPWFYSGIWPQVFQVSGSYPIEELEKELNRSHNPVPDYIFFVNDRELETRVNNIEKLLPGIKQETVIQPGFLDKVLHWLNPINANQVIYIYSNPSSKQP